ncbi:MAG: hypothetical protein ACXIT4_07315 [Erythrobacter sp.]
MFGLGRKDKYGKQVRIGHRGRHIRASRTGGVAARAQGKLGPVNAAANTSTGVRLSTRVAKGTHVALQRGKFRLIGRWNAGPMGFNLSKSGASASLRTGTGTLNFLKPRYSSFKLAGVQVRGKKAAYLQLTAMALSVVAIAAVLAVRLIAVAGWLIYLGAAFAIDLLRGFARGMKASSRAGSADDESSHSAG